MCNSYEVIPSLYIHTYIFIYLIGSKVRKLVALVLGSFLLFRSPYTFGITVTSQLQNSCGMGWGKRLEFKSLGENFIHMYT